MPGNPCVVDLRTFDEACQKYKVNFTREELKKIKKLFGDDDNASMVSKSILDTDQINFHQISYNLGLHRDSYNFLSQSVTSNRAKSLYKLK